MEGTPAYAAAFWLERQLKTMHRTAEIIRQIYALVDELESIHRGRKFTPDGHMIGSIGEAYAAANYELTLLTASFPGHDAHDAEGQYWQIKATGGNSVGLRSCPDWLLVLKLNRDGSMTEIYKGAGKPAWEAAGKMQKNGQRSLSLSALRKLTMQESNEVRGT